MQTKIKIPKGLSLNVSHAKHLRKALDTWLMLKAYFEAGHFSYSTKNLIKLEPICKVSYKTIQQRLKTCQSLGILRKDGKNKRAYLASWNTLSQVFECSSNRFYHINPEILTKKRRLEYILEAKSIQEKQNQCKQARNFKISKANGVKDEIMYVLGGKPKGSLTEAMTKAHINDFATGKANAWLFDSFRGDTQIGYQCLTALFGLGGIGSIAYKKRKLKRLGLIEVHQRAYTFNAKQHTTKDLRKTNLGTVHYDPRNQTINLRMPDYIAFNTQKSLIEA